MFGSTIIEVAIGLSFIFFLLSLISSAMIEIFESFLKNRATDLERGIRELFNQKGGGKLAAEFYNHPMINGLYRGLYKRKNGAEIGPLDYLKPTNLPSYIPAKNFASAVLDIVLHPPADTPVVRDDAAPTNGPASTLDSSPLPATMPAIRSAIRREFSTTQVGRALRTLTEQSGEDVNLLRANLETWFNGSMDRVSGAYKRRTQWVIFAIGLVLAVTLDANTITIAQRLSSDSSVRQVVVNQATSFTNNPDALKTKSEDAKAQLASLGLPLGRPNGFNLKNPFEQNADWWSHFIFTSLLGWLLTAGAVSLGAPFWFDLLNKFMVIRATVKPHEKSLEEGSEDRQDTRKQPIVINQTPAAPAGTAPTGSPLPGGNGSRVGFTPEPQFNAGPDAPDNESHLDEGDLPIETATHDDSLPAAEGGVG